MTDARSSAHWRAGRQWVIAALSPFAVLLALALIPGYLDPLFFKPPDILGVPAAAVFVTAALLWSLLGVAVIRGTRSPIMAGLALLVCTSPAVVVIVFAPIVFDLRFGL